jgi:hypothetical protein
MDMSVTQHGESNTPKAPARDLSEFGAGCAEPETGIAQKLEFFTAKAPSTPSHGDGRSTNAQGCGNLTGGFVHVFERLARESGARLLEERLRRTKLGVGSALRFMPPALAADFLAEHIERRFNLFHRPNAVTLVVVIGLREGRVSVVEQGDGTGGVGVYLGHESKSQKERGQSNPAAEKRICNHDYKITTGLDLSSRPWVPPGNHAETGNRSPSHPLFGRPGGVEYQNIGNSVSGHG